MIPLIIPNFNQLTYLKNLINWWKWYSNDPVYVIDNGSYWPPLIDYYKTCDAKVINYKENSAHKNLMDFCSTLNSEYYCISDPDIMPHPGTPFDFLDIYKYCLDMISYGEHGLQRVGFNLIINDLPASLRNRDTIIFNETEILKTYDPVKINYYGREFTAYRTPIDTTFAMYKKSEGFYAPMSGIDWSRSLRLFQAFHLGWYVDNCGINKEMDNYFRTCIKKDGGQVSAGKNNNCPERYKI